MYLDKNIIKGLNYNYKFANLLIDKNILQVQYERVKSML